MLSFLHGTKLAKFQDNVIFNLKNNVILSPNQIKELSAHNVWVNFSYKKSPTNLALRHFIIKYIVFGDEEYKTKLFYTFNKLTVSTMKCSNINLLWAEGYSYFQYCLEALNLLNLPYINNRTSIIQRTFNKIALHKDHQCYVVPFGDCRKVLSEYQVNIQKSFRHRLIDIFVYDEYIEYTLKKYRLGGNTHTQKHNETITISIKDPEVEYEFYEGYEKKYKNWFEEWKDIIFRFFI